jgi:hypothetical protein
MEMTELVIIQSTIKMAQKEHTGEYQTFGTQVFIRDVPMGNWKAKF